MVYLPIFCLLFGLFCFFT